MGSKLDCLRTLDLLGGTHQTLGAVGGKLMVSQVSRLNRKKDLMTGCRELR